MRELQKSFVGMFYRKVLWESFFGKVLQKVLQKSFKGKFFGKFYRKFYGGNFTKKSFTGETGNQVWIETWKVADPSQLQLRVTDLLASPDLPNFLT